MRFSFVVFLLFSSLFTLGQSFEGTLTYVVDLEVNEKMLRLGLTKESLIKDRVRLNNKDLFRVVKQDTTIDNSEKEKVILVEPESPPTFKDGGDVGMQKFIQENLKYPQGECARGTVYVDVTIDATGQGRNFTIAKGLSPITDEEALRVVKLMKFNPGTFNGIPKEMKLRIPIKFDIVNED